MIYPLILSGGAGSRLWPVSRSAQPKQFLALWSEQPLIVDTAKRAGGEGFAAPTVVCNHEHRFLVAEAFAEADIAPLRILLEPLARNTAAAIAAGGLSIAATDPDALILVLPSDHVIADEAAFHAAIRRGADAARRGALVTFGIVPTHPETGYGYIQQGADYPSVDGVHAVARFVEKPDYATARQYIEGGGYFWNAGIFLFSVATVLEAFRRYAPDVLTAAQAAVSNAVSDLDFLRLDEAAFAASPTRSFDVAVMEATDHGAVVPVSMGWSDIGSWDALWRTVERDENGNHLLGDALAIASRDSLAWSADGMVTAMVGVKNLAVVVQDDAVLVIDRSHAEQVKDLVALFQGQAREIHHTSRKVGRPWGAYQVVDNGPGHIVKRLTIRPGGQLSLQYHHHRAEHWVVVEGTATITKGSETFELATNQSVYIPRGTVHRLENRTDAPLALIEVQTGTILREDDIVRLDDCYGRLS